MELFVTFQIDKTDCLVHVCEPAEKGGAWEADVALIAWKY